jgi:hypothetical protein
MRREVWIAEDWFKETIMSQMNPLTSSILQAPTAQRIMDADKSQQIRHVQDTHKNAATSDEQEVEESVASADEAASVGDQPKNGRQQKGTYSRRPPKPNPNPEGDPLDLTA